MGTIENTGRLGDIVELTRRYVTRLVATVTIGGILFFYLPGETKASGIEPSPAAARGFAAQDKKAISAEMFRATGYASWYGDPFHGRRTASGEVYNKYEFTAAHPQLPLGTKAKVTNLKNNRSVVVDINDRGPFVKGRILDLSLAAARQIGMVDSGIARVRIEVLPVSE